MTLQVRLLGTKQEIDEFLEDIEAGVHPEAITQLARFAANDGKTRFYKYFTWDRGKK